MNEMITPEPKILEKLEFSDVWIRRKRILNSFWKKWIKDYLEQLSVNKRWTKPETINLKVGDIVIIKPETIKKNQWNLGRIIEVVKNDVDIVNKVKTKPTSGPTLLRTVRQVALLEPNFDYADDEGVHVGSQSDGVLKLSDGSQAGDGQPPSDQPPVLVCPPDERYDALNSDATMDFSIAGENEIEEKIELDKSRLVKKRTRHHKGYYKTIKKQD
jgi:hypothetical protein